MGTWDDNQNYGDDEQQGGGGGSGEGLFPAGRHRGRASAWGLGETSQGKPQLAITFDLLDHPGKQLSYYGSFSEEAFEHTMKAARACGWTGDDFSDMQGLDANEVSLVVAHDTYNGKTTAKVKWVNAPGGVALKKQLDPNQAKAFAAQMRGRVAAYDQQVGGGQRPPASGNGRSPQGNGGQRPPQQTNGARQSDPRDYGYTPPPRNDRDAPPQRGRGGPPPQGQRGFDGRDMTRHERNPGEDDELPY